MRIQLIYKALIACVALFVGLGQVAAQAPGRTPETAIASGNLPWLDFHPAEKARSCITKAQHQAIKSRVQAARKQPWAAALYAPNHAAQTRSTRMAFQHPMVWKDGIEGFYHAGVLTAYADHNPLSGSLDYACGAKTYDGHTGTDYMAFPFPWWAMDQDMAQVVAAAPGKILLKEDGHFDRSCTSPDSMWNAVYVLHNDGSVAWYGHLKSGSLTSKTIGQSVDAGEFLGIAGSSGRSTGPHLHFEVYDSAGNWIDPFLGGCGNATRSWWNEQKPYRDTRITALGFHADFPEWLLCADPGEDAIDWRSTFWAGEEAYIGVYVQDPYAGLDLNVRVLDPNGRVAKVYRHDFAGSSQAGYALFSMDLAHSAAYGTWQVEVEVGDEQVYRSFDYCYNDVLCSCPTPNGTFSVYQGSASYGLYWDEVPQALLYRVQKQGPENGIGEVLSNNTDLNDLERGGTYRWRIRSMCGPIGSPWSNWVSMNVPMLDVRLEEELMALRESPAGQYRILSLQGQVLWSGDMDPSKQTLELPSGTYLLEQRRSSGSAVRLWLQP